MPVSILLTAGLTIAPAFALHLNRIPAASAFEISAGPAWVQGPDLPSPLSRLVGVVSPPTTRPPTTTTTTTTTTTAPPTTPLAPAADPEPAPTHTQTGRASWYAGRKGKCAHRTIPLRTVLRVVNLANGKETRCTVTNRGPFRGDRVLDLTKATFAELAPVSKGVIHVRIEH